MTAVLTLIVLAVAAATLLLARRRRQPELVPAYAKRREEPTQSRQAQPEQAQRPARGCNW